MCKIDVNPYLIETVPPVTRQAMGSEDPVLVTPERDVVKCPREDCLNVWYTPHIDDAAHIT